jgi:plasmid stabilization system protein ParE
VSVYAFHPDAFADLEETWEYIARDNIDAADRVLADIDTVLRTLAASPHIGHRRPDLTARPLRRLDETLTILALGLSDRLRQSLATTTRSKA